MASVSSPLRVHSLCRSSLGAELRALAAVARREWVIFLRYPTWVLSVIAWPIIFPAAYILSARALAGPDGSGLALFTQAAGTGDYLGYIAIGTTIYMWQNVVLWQVGMALREEQLRGTLETNWLSPTWRFSYLLGNSLAQFGTMLIFMAASALEFGLFFGVRYHGSLALALLVLLAAIPSIYGLAFAFASLVMTAREASSFVYLVRGLVMIFCGITFPVSLLPGWMQWIAKWLPQSYLIHGMRAAAFSNAGPGELASDLIPLLLFGLFWLLSGYFIFMWMERRARKTGAIGQY